MAENEEKLPYIENPPKWEEKNPHTTELCEISPFLIMLRLQKWKKLDASKEDISDACASPMFSDSFLKSVRFYMTLAGSMSLIHGNFKILSAKNFVDSFINHTDVWFFSQAWRVNLKRILRCCQSLQNIWTGRGKCVGAENAMQSAWWEEDSSSWIQNNLVSILNSKIVIKCSQWLFKVVFYLLELDWIKPLTV